MEKKIKTAEEQIFILKFPNEEYNANDFNDWAKENSEEAYRYCLGAFKALLSESLPSEREAELLKEIAYMKDYYENKWENIYVQNTELQSEITSLKKQIEELTRERDSYLNNWTEAEFETQNLKNKFKSLSTPVSEVPTDASLLEEIDDLFARLEDFTHGKDGEDITKMRYKIQEVCTKAFKNSVDRVLSSKLSGTIDEGKKKITPACNSKLIVALDWFRKKYPDWKSKEPQESFAAGFNYALSLPIKKEGELGPTGSFSRIEVINHNPNEVNYPQGRALVSNRDDNCVFYNIQDNGRTLKVFIEKSKSKEEGKC